MHFLSFAQAKMRLAILFPLVDFKAEEFLVDSNLDSDELSEQNSG